MRDGPKASFYRQNIRVQDFPKTRGTPLRLGGNIRGLSPRLLPSNISAAEAPPREEVGQRLEEVGRPAVAAHSRLTMSAHQAPDFL
jgi:hypothetical protein